MGGARRRRGWPLPFSLVEEAQRNYTSGICREAKSTGRKLKLDISDLGGPLIFLLIVAVCSLVINRIASAAHAREQQLEAAYHDGTLHTSAVEAAHNLARKSFSSHVDVVAVPAEAVRSADPQKDADDADAYSTV